VAVLVDDVDRCEPTAVVRLLESLHTVFSALPVAFVVAGDGRWIARAFETAYANADGGAGSPGRPLGYLFLEKLFQFSVTVPDMPEPVKQRFWHKLLHPESRLERPAPTKPDLSALKTEDAILNQVRSIDPEKDPEAARAIRHAAIDRLTDEDLIAQPSPHVLELFQDVVEPNPRAMKRYVMAYGMARGVDLASFRDTPQPVLAAWTILSLRWPALAAWLKTEPDRLRWVTPAAGERPGRADRDYVTLMSDPLVKRIAGHLDPIALRRLLGMPT
jgi:hypothetical protein